MIGSGEPRQERETAVQVLTEPKEDGCAGVGPGRVGSR